MKVFKYKFTRLTTAFIYIGIVLCVIGLGINTYSVVTADLASEPYPVYPVIRFVLLYLIPVALLVVLISLLVSSYYSIDGSILKTSFGIIKSKYKTQDITSVVLDRTTNKLSVFFKNNSFIVIVVKEEWYDEFINELCKANKNIDYTIKSKENNDTDGKKK